ncbi:MAG TPA: DUF4870 domain-containing protein [Gemmataceae bacterium]
MNDDDDDREPLADGPLGPPSIPSTPDERQMALFAHLGGIGGFMVPLIIWILKKDESEFVDDQGKEALNFHLTLMIGHLIGGLSICFTWGVLNLVCWVLGIVFGVIGGMAAQKGEVYRYPMTIRFIK